VQPGFPQGVQASAAGLALDDACPQQLQEQREQLKQREEDLEQRYRKLQDYAQSYTQSQMGTRSELAAAHHVPSAELRREAESEHMQSFSHEPRAKLMHPLHNVTQSEQHGKKARNHIESANGGSNRVDTDRPPQSSPTTVMGSR